MEESKDLKAGMESSYTIGGKTVKMKPLTLGKMKKATQVFQKKGADTFDMMLDSLFEILSNGENVFATREWINDNVTMPLATQILSDMRTINGLGDNNGFFQAAAPAAKSLPTESRDLTEVRPTH